MFSYLSQIISLFTGGSGINGEHAKENLNVFPEISSDSNNDSNVNKRSFDGTITSFFNNQGLINDHIFFTSSVVAGREQPQVGDVVYAEASRSHSEGGWVALSVQITSLWNIGEEVDHKPYKDHVVASVISCNLNQACIKTHTEMNVSLKKLKLRYKPFKGDWVRIELWRKPGEKSDNNFTEDDIISIGPLRERKLHGTITEVCNGFGFINDDIYFHLNSCEKGYKAQRGDSVVACVIESKQKRGIWRAVDVCMKKMKPKAKKERYVETSFNDNEIMLGDHAIEITDEIEFSEIFANETARFEIWIKNLRSSDITFVGLQIMKNVPGFSWKFCSKKDVDGIDSASKGNALCPNMVISAGEKKMLPIEFIPQELGKTNFQIVFSFSDCEISRCISAVVSEKLHKELKTGSTYIKPKATFFGKQINNRLCESWVVPGQRPVRKMKTFLPNKLPRYPVPTYLRDCILHSEGDVELLIPELVQPLHISNYKKKLSSMLYAEEIQMELEMREFDLHNVLLRPVGQFFSLAVPGLAEGRPSLLLGDRVVVKFCEKGDKSPCYEGFIHEVHADDVYLKFNEEFHTLYRNDDLDVEFYFNRTPMRRSHQAVEQALNLGEEVLFPTCIIPKESLFHLSTDVVKPYNKFLNPRQLLAVTRVLEGRGRPIPYVLFGPPGTGKSVTVVECILQVFKHIQYSRILACAPSNSAADLIAERLHQSGLVRPSDLLRLNAFQRNKVNIPEEIEKYCTSNTDDLYIASRHRIIVTTCNMAGILYSFDLKVGHFTHIFVDEAGQATEPECLIPIGFAAGCEESQIVLAGDPFQLGPVLRSDIAEEFGLQTSFLERLTTSKLYKRNEILFEHCYNPLVVTKLVNNYRSHEHLLHLSSCIFYDRELISCAEEKQTSMFIGSKILVNQNSPFIFHGLRSEDLREGNSPSWFNPMEAVQVLKYVQNILNTHAHVELEDIGIITPYRKQVEKIRVLLERFNLSAIKVGSVEEFQGQERLCVIISTVRSNETMVDFDCIHNVGFLSNPKRFNVAITRAQAILIVVGNPVVLCYDPYWCAMLQYAVMTGSYTGCDLPTLDKEIIQENFKKATCLLGLSTTMKHSSKDTKFEASDVSAYRDASVNQDENGGREICEFVDEDLPRVITGEEETAEETFRGKRYHLSRNYSAEQNTTDRDMKMEEVRCTQKLIKEERLAEVRGVGISKNKPCTSPHKRTNALLSFLKQKSTTS